MKSTAYCFILLSSLFFISCEKETDTIPVMNIDSLYSTLPKQVTHTLLYAVPVVAYAYSIKYDTANLLIEFYEDDTSNSNPYDRIHARYGYNAAGYLTNFTKWSEGTLMEKHQIQRSSDNKILWIAHQDYFWQNIDTTWLNYQVQGSQTTITATEIAYYDGSSVANFDTIIHVYDNDWRLQETTDKEYITTYEYNLNNSLKKTLTLTNNFSYTSDFSYASGLPEGKQDWVSLIILGRDHHLQQIKNLYLLSSFMDRDLLMVSATDPFHPTMMMDTRIENGITTRLEKYTWDYQLNDLKQLSTINARVNDEASTIAELKY